MMWMDHLTNRTNLKAEQQFKLKDNVNNNYKLIYREQRNISFMIVSSYYFGWLGFICSTFGLGYLLIKNPPLREKGKIDDFGGEVMIPLSKFGRIAMVFGGIALSFSIIMVSKIMPIRIYHNPTEKLYKAVFAYNVWSKAPLLTFGEGTVVPKFNKYFKDLVFNINGHTILLDKESFPVPYVREQMICRR